MIDERIFSYLLGELPGREARRFEEECFAGEEWPEEVGRAEKDLIDAYLYDELTPEQRRRFEQNYLTTDARRKRFADRYVMAAAILRHINPAPAVPKPVEPTWIKSFLAFWGTQSPALRAGLTVGVIVVVVGAVWLARSRTNSPRTFATLTLSINVDSNRAEGAQAGRVRLTPDTDALRIYLRLPSQPATAANYRVELVNEDGETRPLTAAGQNVESVFVEISTPQLTRGEYALRLFAVRPDGTEQRVNGVYLFIVE